MSDSADLCRAISFAAEAMAECVDRQGRPAILHAMRVCLAGETIEEQIVGVLHDVVEDTSATVDDIRDQFDNVIAQAVDDLTRRKSYETYADYINRLSPWELPRSVKINDLRDNLLRCYAFPDQADAASLSSRYEKALDLLAQRHRSASSPAAVPSGETAP